MKDIVAAIQAVVPLTPVEQELIRESVVPRSLKKGAYFVDEFEVCHEIAFVHEGRLRVYYHNTQGEEITCYFAEPGTFVAAFTSFLTQAPSKDRIQAIEPVQLSVWSREELERMSKQIPILQEFRRIQVENLYLMMERRVAMLQAKSARERYEMTLKENPELILQVPLQYLASFLGITPQHLSRLRKQQAGF